jgi:putative DNA primase/helicase
LKAEAAGVLSWIVRGALAWRQNGLGTAAAVTDATRAYRESENIVAEFIEAKCVTGDSAAVGATELYAAFRRHLSQAGEECIPNQRRFGQSMTRLGYPRFTNNGTFYGGIMLRETKNEWSPA